MKVIGRHKKWVPGATITESYDENNDKMRRFIATIRGFRNWKIYEGNLDNITTGAIKHQVAAIRDAIDRGGESIFEHKGYFLINWDQFINYYLTPATSRRKEKTK